ncbi:class I SAM-dependent methyltransferase [Streptomyces sp. NPDC051130]|uniref:class I SAM-dependent methyltransferase n=1 Tax=Streptomyces sp. NPDC051130 TaxID=3157223 RepID=UPI00344ABAB7
MNPSAEKPRWYESAVRMERIASHIQDAATVPFMEACALPVDEVAEIDERYHDAEADTYDAYSDIPRIREAEKWIVPWIRDAARPGLIIDLGTGTGRVAAQIQGPSRQVIAVDRSKHMLAAAQRRLDPSCSVVLRADARDLPLHDASVDTVICSGVLHHIPSWPDVVREMGRILKPQGVLIVREPNADYPAGLFEPLESLLSWVARRTQRTARQTGAATAPDGAAPVETLSPVEAPIALADLVKAATSAGLRRQTVGSVKFLASLGIPDEMPGQQLYFVPANLVDRAAHALTGHRYGSLILSTFVKEERI